MCIECQHLCIQVRTYIRIIKEGGGVGVLCLTLLSYQVYSGSDDKTIGYFVCLTLCCQEVISNVMFDGVYSVFCLLRSGYVIFYKLTMPNLKS